LKEESSSVLKKGGARLAETKKLLISVDPHRPRRVGFGNGEGTKVFCFFFSKKKCLPLLFYFHPIAPPGGVTAVALLAGKATEEAQLEKFQYGFDPGQSWKLANSRPRGHSPASTSAYRA
jgi:hypothetical protein